MCLYAPPGDLTTPKHKAGDTRHNKRQPRIIPYNHIEAILGDHMIKYQGLVWVTQEDVKLFPDVLHIYNPMPQSDYDILMVRLIDSIEGAH
jgi:hypothetical protein